MTAPDDPFGPRVRPGPFVVLALALTATLAALAAGRALPGLPVGDLAQIEAWIERHGAVLAVASVARVLALVVAIYLVATVGLALVARAAHLRALAALVDRFSLPIVRRAVHGVAGMALTIGVAGGVAQASPAAPPTMVVVSRPPTDIAVMSAVDEPPAPPAAAATPEPSVLATSTIAPGDHLWGVAARTLAAHRHRAPTDDEVAAYLVEIVAHNVDRLAVPDHPDLVFPGQVFELPALDPE